MGGGIFIIKVLCLLCWIVGRSIKKGNVKEVRYLFKSSIRCWVINGFGLVNDIVYVVFVGCGEVDFVGVGRGVGVYGVGLCSVVFIFKILGLDSGGIG